MMLDFALKHDFGGFTLDLAFQSGPGITAIFGRSGAGKSTIIKTIAGLFQPQEARVILDGARLDALPPHRRRVGVVFQDARLFPHLSVAQNIDFGARFAKGPALAPRDDLIALLGLGPLQNRAPRTLSGGEAQRVAIARALNASPRLLLLDEPLASLDAPRKADILPYLERLKSETGLPMIYVSHALDEIARLADDILLIEAGRLARHGPVFDVLAEPEWMPLLGVREAGAILPAKVVRHDPDGLTRLRVAAGHLDLPGISAPVGATLRLRILASDVLISRMAPEGLSAMNALPVTIRKIHRGQGPGTALVLDAGGDTLLARLTERSVARLDLQEGGVCFAVLKAMSVAQGAVGLGRAQADDVAPAQAAPSSMD